MKRLCIVFGCLGLVLAGARMASADGVVLDGLGARVSGRGGTNLGFTDNGMVILDNPAGMARVGDGLVEFDASLLITDMHYADADNSDVGGDHDPFPSAQAAFIRQAPGGRFSYGIGMFSPAGFGADYDMEGPAPWGGSQHYKSLGMLTRVLPGAAYRVTDQLSIGATLGVGVSHVELEGPYFLQSAGAFQGAPTMLDLQSTGAGISWSTGLQYALTPATTLGVTYQDQTPIELHGSARVETQLLGDTGYDVALDVTWPRWLGLGIRHEFCPHRIVSAEVIWFDWSSAFDSFDLRFADPTDPLYAAIVGPGLDESLPLEWHDSISIRLGHERWLNDKHVFRCGYIYHRNPIPNGTLTPYVQATLEHNFTLGYGRVGRHWETDLAYQYAFDAPRDAGASDLLGGDFDGARHHAQAHVAAIGFIRRW